MNQSPTTIGSKARLPALAFAMVMVAASLLMNSPAQAQGAAALHAASSEAKSAETPPVTLPEHLTREDIRTLMSRLSDQEVRELLIQQLDKVAEQEAMPEPAVMMDRFEASLPALKNRLTLMASAIGDLPSIGPFVVNKITQDDPSRVWVILFYTAVMVAGGIVGEWLFRHLFSRGVMHPRGEKTPLLDRVCILGLRLLVDLLGIAVFALCTLGLFFIFYQGHAPVRQAVGALYWSVILIRSVAAITRFAVAPRAPALRLPPIADVAAVKLYRRVVWISAAIIIAVLIMNLFEAFGMEKGLFLLCGRIASLMVIAFIIAIVWHDRRGIADLIQSGPEEGGEPAGPVKRLLAANWHILATCYLAGVFVHATIQTLLTGARNTGPAVTSIAVLIAIPFVDWTMQAGLKRLLRTSDGTAGENADDNAAASLQTLADEGEPPVAPTKPDQKGNEYFRVLLRNLRIVLAIVVAVALAEVWDIDMRGTAAAGVGEVLANSIFDIVITLVLASAIWGIVKTAISQRLPDKGAVGGSGAMEGEAGGAGGTRLETLLPLFRKFLFVTLIVIAGLIVLSELGVDIGPLIAGAGIVGIAIGFGAQTLVRDIVSGVFFLIEDAFRVGEYIQISGGTRGMVEDISIRSLRLRHHNGPIHTVPFGEIKTLTNFSRDWVIMKLEMRLPFETDIEKVRKIVKKVGQDLMAHEEHGKNFLQPLKSQGVNRMDDSAFIFRIKFMAKPGEQFVLRREVYRRVQEALAEHDIHFAPKRVIVDTAGISPEQAATAVAAAATEAEEDPTPSAAGAKS